MLNDPPQIKPSRALKVEIEPASARKPILGGRDLDRLRLVSANDVERAAKPLRIALVSTYAPRKCGIATFSEDVRSALLKAAPDAFIDVWPIVAPGEFVSEKQTVTEGDHASFRAAARAIDAVSTDLVILQHEFGLFGGSAGDVVLELTSALACPLIVTFHTVLPDPDAEQERVMRALIERAARLVVMSERSRDLLVSRYGADPAQVALIEHGVPDRPFGRSQEFKTKLGFFGPVLLTFGLLSPGKGIESAIRALPAIVEKHPDATYCIAGATHPNLVAREGEAYREGLIELAHSLGVGNNIRWVNRFLEYDQLLDLIEAADIYLTPYPGAEQSTSGTLAYAVALGKAVISTPYVHAQELLADAHGVLVPFGSPDAIAEAANALLDDPAWLARMQRRAYARGRGMTWKCYGEKMLALAEQLRVTPHAYAAPLGPLPLEGVIRLSDDCGILQHGIGGIPDRRHGYCIDDNARALILMNRIGQNGGRVVGRMASTYASFVQYAWNEDLKCFRNFMSYSREWLEERGSEDSNGRALWALGATVEEAAEPRLREWAAKLYNQALPMADGFGSPRAMAFAMIGAAHRLAADPGHGPSRELLGKSAAFLMSILDASRRPDWAWFEAMLAYDNARLPEALIRAGTVLDRPQFIDAGLETLKWVIERQMSADRYFRPVGTESFGRSYEDPMPFDQQPLEAWATIDACAIAHKASGSRKWVEAAHAAFAWYCGGNDRGLAVGDIESGSCYDGLNPQGVNLNSGAESVLAFQLASVSMRALLNGISQA